MFAITFVTITGASSEMSVASSSWFPGRRHAGTSLGNVTRVNCMNSKGRFLSETYNKLSVINKNNLHFPQVGNVQRIFN